VGVGARSSRPLLSKTKKQKRKHTDTNETFRTERSEKNIPTEVGEGGTGVDDVVCRIENSLLGDVRTPEDGDLGDVKPVAGTPSCPPVLTCAR
jgi:hypothetical protein